jgi:hypothetical protein
MRSAAARRSDKKRSALASQGQARWLNHYVSIQNTAEITI